ncbi:MAG: helix-turn-helix domain-containing protein [Defluviitaleaceae bacterium]|nr:helix-turn-helix domain-containing protein [Defluviitaleaceae bacterium]
MSIIQREELPVGCKIYKLRKHLGVNQDELAEIIRARKERVSHVEKGKDEYTEAHLHAIREHFKIEGLPLSKHECIVIYRRLYHLRNLIRTRRLGEARDIQDGLANIDNLEPCDPDMVMLSKMLEIQLLIAEGYYLDAEKNLIFASQI